MSLGWGKRFGRRRWLLAALAAVWLLLFFALAWPTLKASRANDEKIAELDRQVSRMGGWSDIGPRGRNAVPLWQKELDERFNALFPREIKIQEFFYELSLIAVESGIDPITVSVAPGKRRPPSKKGSEIEPEVAALISQLGMRSRELPGNRIQPQGVKVSFESSYDELTRFIALLGSIPRAVTVKTLDVKRGHGGVSVELELEYYVQAT